MSSPQIVDQTPTADKTTLHAELYCKKCDTRAQALAGDVDQLEIEVDEFNSAHADCGRPRDDVAIEKFNNLMPPQHYMWRKGDPAPAWMGRRPSWADDHHQSGEKFCATECFWLSQPIRIPKMNGWGTTSPDRDYRSLPAMELMLRARVGDLNPVIYMRLPEIKGTGGISLTFDEVQHLIDALTLLRQVAADDQAQGGAANA